MKIRSKQRIARGNNLEKSSDITDVSLEFGLLSEKVAKAFDAWGKGRGEMAECLTAIATSLLRLAEMAGTDLQEVVGAKLAVGKSGAGGLPPNGLLVEDAAVAAIAAMNQGKLVRDKIPQIIRSKGQEPVVHKASAEEYKIRLRDKLREEVEEYLASDNDREELADILEVLYALARQAGTDQQQLEKLRAAKAEKRGGFADQIVWFCNQPQVAAQGMRIAAR
jgi:predicted house-cleaning noncanonical NTP pyrophosphatase (MazG superfamily)